MKTHCKSCLLKGWVIILTVSAVAWVCYDISREINRCKEKQPQQPLSQPGPLMENPAELPQQDTLTIESKRREEYLKLNDEPPFEIFY